MKLLALVRLFAKISLVFTFIVIIAGSIVRMTGSGMGCPDWPKCFGYYIPPIDKESLSYTSGKSFDKGQMVIMNDTLWVAHENLHVVGTFDSHAWHKYPKHDYAVFNSLHTWVEYINRLATVLYAIPIVILSFLCLLMLLRKKDWITFLLALFTDIMIGYEIWLGKLVVDGNLKENSITYHMIGSILIVSLLLLLIFRLRKNSTHINSSIIFRLLLFVLLVCCLIQILLGTQVREEVDIVAKNIDDRSEWVAHLPGIFLIHRSFSILITLIAGVLFVINRKMKQRIQEINAIVLLIGLEIVVGIVLGYFSMPKELQPLHLLLGVIMFAYVFYSFLISTNKLRTV